jgi:4-amino-4-deoxy-L-arabinose transferase-like glycosyltransferase
MSETLNSRNNPQLLHRAIWLGILFVYILLRIKPIGIPLDRDEGVFGLIGKTILNGGLPYLDGIDHKPPVVFYIYAIMLSIFPPNAIGVHLFLHIYNLITLYVLFLFVKRIANGNTAYWSSLFFAILSINPNVQGFTASTEMFMLLPIAASLLLAVVGADGDRVRYGYLVVSGICGALACWIKQPAVFSVFFAIVIIVYRLWTSNTQENRIFGIAKGVLIWLAGGMSVSLLIVGYFAMHGILSELFYWSFQHSILYSETLPISDRITMAWYGFLRLVENSPILFGLALLSFFIKSDEVKIPIPLFALFFVLSIIGASIGFAYPHYYAQIIPPVVIIAGIACSSIMQKMNNEIRRYSVGSILVVTIMLVEVVVNSGYHFFDDGKTFSRKYFGVNPFPEAVVLAKYLREKTSIDDKIFVYGSEPEILLQANRSSASAFYVIYPLMRSAFPRYLEFQKRTIDEIKKTEPKYIINVQLPPSLLYDGKAKLVLTQFLKKYIAANYTLDNALFFSEQQQMWLSVKNKIFQQGGKRLPIFIQLYKKNQ